MDDRLRELERRWRESGDVEKEARYLQELVRRGQLSAERIELAAYLGHPAACTSSHEELQALAELDELARGHLHLASSRHPELAEEIRWLGGLARFNKEAALRAALIGAWSLPAAGWAVCPCEHHARVALGHVQEFQAEMWSHSSADLARNSATAVAARDEPSQLLIGLLDAFLLTWPGAGPAVGSFRGRVSAGLLPWALERADGVAEAVAAAVEQAFAGLGSEDPRLREEAAQSLLSLGTLGNSAAERLEGLSLEDPSPQVRQLALRASFSVRGDYQLPTREELKHIERTTVLFR